MLLVWLNKMLNEAPPYDTYPEDRFSYLIEAFYTGLGLLTLQ